MRSGGHQLCRGLQVSGLPLSGRGLRQTHAVTAGDTDVRVMHQTSDCSGERKPDRAGSERRDIGDAEARRQRPMSIGISSDPVRELP